MYMDVSKSMRIYKYVMFCCLQVLISEWCCYVMDDYIVKIWVCILDGAHELEGNLGQSSDL
jgi:hypothetical protein